MYIEYDEKFLEAVKLFNDGNIKDSFILLIDIIENENRHGRSHELLGFIYMDYIGDLERAEHHFYEASIYDSADGYLDLLLKMRRFDDLEKYLTYCFSIKNLPISRIYETYGYLYELTERYSQAINSYQLAIKNTVNNVSSIDYYESRIDMCNKKMTLDQDPHTLVKNKKYFPKRYIFIFAIVLILILLFIVVLIYPF